MALTVMLNGLVIGKYAHIFTVYGKGPWGPFMSRFHVSGFDSIIYTIISHWSTFYHIGVRHPLLAFLLYPLSLLNRLLYSLTGLNCVQFLFAAILVFCSVYSFIFLTRTLHRGMGISRAEANLLGFYTYSFAYIMLTVCVPDHFALSFLLLTLTLWLAVSTRAESHHPAPAGENNRKSWSAPFAFLLTFITAGITLTNGVKTMMASFYVNGKRMWRPKYVIIGLLMPILLNLCISHVQYQLIGRPAEKMRAKNKAINNARRLKAKKARTLQWNKPGHHTTSPPKKGKALSKNGILVWSDVSTPRIPAAVHNFFGESLQLHADSLLQDVGIRRPIIVKYRSPLPYIIEGVMVCLMLAGLWCGRRSRLLWLMAGWFVYDMVIHFVMGFALNEVYIMTAHWAFILPLATAYLLRRLHGRRRMALNTLLALLTLYLAASNGWLMISYLLG